MKENIIKGLLDINPWEEIFTALIYFKLVSFEGTSTLSIKNVVETAKLKKTHPITLKRLTKTIEEGFLGRAIGKSIKYEIDIPHISYPV